MKSILFVIFNTEVGGIYSSLLGILKFLDSTNMYRIDVLSLNGENDSVLSKFKNVSWKQTPKLIASCYSNKTEIQNKGFSYKILYILTRTFSKVVGWNRLSQLVTKCVRAKKTYDFAVSFANDIYDADGVCIETGCNDFVRNSVCAVKKIGWIHELPNTSGYTKSIIQNVYKGFDTVVNCSEAVKKVFDQIAGRQGFISTYVNNILDTETIRKKSEENIDWDGSRYHIVTIARIDNEAKRLDRIPDIMHNLIMQGNKDTLWHIIGDGKDFDWLKELIHSKKMGDRIILEGKKENPYPYLKGSEVYVQTSDYESMPMVVLEAEILGVPVVSTDYPSAMEMIPKNCGIVCKKDTVELAKAIQFILDNRKKYSEVSFEQKGEKQLLSLFV